MGLSPFKNCSTNYGPPAPAPNPDPSRWLLLDAWIYDDAAYVLRVRYLDATNFEGMKVMVYRGKAPTWVYPEASKESVKLDPHFTPRKSSPIARFRPDAEGIAMAKAMAESIRGETKTEPKGKRWRR